MQRAAYFLSATVGVMIMGWSGVAFAQPTPRINGLTPLQIQRFSRDLTPSSAQDFFRTGQANLEQEIQVLTRRRSRPGEPLLKINQDAKTQSNQQLERLDRASDNPVK